ncbi:MAG: DUF424 family protein [Thermoprotei archaeon]
MRRGVAGKSAPVRDGPRKGEDLSKLVLLAEHRLEKVSLTVVCEPKLIGKTLGKHFKVDAGYFGGEPVTVEYALNVASTSLIATFLGNTIVELAVRAGLVDPAAVTEFGGVKYAEVYRL